MLAPILKCKLSGTSKEDVFEYLENESYYKLRIVTKLNDLTTHTRIRLSNQIHRRILSNLDHEPRANVFMSLISIELKLLDVKLTKHV